MEEDSTEKKQLKITLNGCDPGVIEESFSRSFLMKKSTRISTNGSL